MAVKAVKPAEIVARAVDLGRQQLSGARLS
jgi:hypothetical protein